MTLTADVMFVCGFPFLVTYSRSIKLITAEFIPTRNARQLAKLLMKVVYGYARGRFLVTYSRSIKLTTTEYIPTRTAGQLAKSLMKVVYGYARGGFVVNLALMDLEFEKIKDELPLVEVNTTAAREHVPEIERRIRTIKERVRSATSDFPFDPIPMMVLIQTVYTIIMWLNAVWSLSGVAGGLSPRELVTGRGVDYNKDCRTDFGAYV